MMTKQKRAPSLSSARVTASLRHCRPKTDNRNLAKDLVKSVGEESIFDSGKGCRPYVCNNGNLHSNCIDQFLKSGASPPIVLCPLCRGPYSEWIDAGSAPGELVNSITRSCSVGTCAELEKHASSEHPSVGFVLSGVSGPSNIRRTARMSVRLFPRRQLASRGLEN